MAIIVHLTSEKNVSGILRTGVKAESLRGRYQIPIPAGVFCMPVLPDFQISHQWLRELKRSGQKTIVGIYCRLSSEEPVWVGHYSQIHLFTTLGKAIGEILRSSNPEGYQLVVPRSLRAREIHRVKSLPQGVGWRYFPGSHREKPHCACFACIPLGSIKSKKLRDRLRR